jgi:hypothetical protein
VSIEEAFDEILKNGNNFVKKRAVTVLINYYYLILLYYSVLLRILCLIFHFHICIFFITVFYYFAFKCKKQFIVLKYVSDLLGISHLLILNQLHQSFC